MGLFPRERDLTQAPDRVELAVRASDYRIRPAELQLRLDAFLLRHLHWRSRQSIQALIRDGYVLVDPMPPERPAGAGLHVETRPSRRLRHGARVVVRIPEELRIPVTLPPGEEDLSVLYEDEDVIAVDKPPLLPVHPSGRHLADTLIQRLHARYQVEAAESGGPLPIRLCHRLDRETSGIVLCGKRRAAHRKLRIQFERRSVEKEYLAIVEGNPDQDEGVIDLPLGPSHASAVHLKIAVVPDGLPSRTHWRVVERRADCALVSCRLDTGRQHQIRVHLQALGHPLVGDKLYGPDERYFLRQAAGELGDEDLALLRLPRHALHNHRLVFRSPSDGKAIEVVSPLPDDLATFLRAAGPARLAP